uniref:RNA polymerase II subunit B1 CTD phosphatase RPAP2 homolog n=1 Tax=Angiostrongylus cantonensis TaxID=6313 RepID=A0A0K0CZL1_ANGCA
MVSAPSTVHWTSPTTVNACGETDPTALIETLKDSGVYNEIYMAPDILTASRNFPDLGGRNFMKAKSRYRCDDTCERSSELVRLVMIGDEQLESPPLESEQSWWNEWTREKRRSFTSKSKTERLHELENSLQNLLREMDEISRDEVEQFDKQSEQKE